MDIFKRFNFSEWFKTPPKPADVKTAQTDDQRVELLYRELDNHPSRGLTPAKLATLFTNAEAGDLRSQAEFFLDMREKDVHIDAELSKRIMAVKQLDWTLTPPRDASATEKRRTKDLENLIRDEININSLRMDMLDAIGHGYACIELGWSQTLQGQRFPNSLEHRSPTWFVCPTQNRNTIHLRNFHSGDGEPLQPFGWIPHIQKARSGYITRAGLMRSLAWPYLYKNFSVRDLAEFLEVYGLPIRVGKYNTNATDKEKRDLLRTVLSIGHNAAGIIPDTMAIELQSIIAGGNADGFKIQIDWCEEKQSMAILGGTLTSKTGANGNRSLGDVHNEVRMDIRDDDATQVDFSLSRFLVYPMGMLNGWFADNRCPNFQSDIQDAEDLGLFGEAIPKLVQSGVKIPVFYVNQKLKIPEPAQGDEILAYVTRSETITTDSADIPNTQAATTAAAKLVALMNNHPQGPRTAQISATGLPENAAQQAEHPERPEMASQPGQPDNAAQQTQNFPGPNIGHESKDGIDSGTAAATRTEARAGKDAPTKPGLDDDPAQHPNFDPTPITAETDLLAAAAAPSIKAMVDDIRSLVEKADTLETLRDQLLNGYGHLDNSDLINIFEIAFATANLAGRFDVSEGG